MSQMITPIRPRPVTSLASARNSRTRIYAAGADPKFSRSVRQPTFRLVPAFPASEQVEREKDRLWRPEVLDRLQTPLTHYPE